MKALKRTLILLLFPLASFAGGSDGGPGVLQPILMANAISVKSFDAPMVFKSKANSYDLYSNDNGWVEYDKYWIKFVSISNNKAVNLLVDDGETVHDLTVNEEVLSDHEGLTDSLEYSQEVRF